MNTSCFLFKENEDGCGWLYVPRIKNIERKKKLCSEVRPALSKRKILTHTSLPYCRFDLLNSSTEQTAKGPHSAESSLQVMKVVTKQKPFDLCRLATGLRRVADNTNRLQKCFINNLMFL